MNRKKISQTPLSKLSSLHYSVFSLLFFFDSFSFTRFAEKLLINKISNFKPAQKTYLFTATLKNKDPSLWRSFLLGFKNQSNIHLKTKIKMIWPIYERTLFVTLSIICEWVSKFVGLIKVFIISDLNPNSIQLYLLNFSESISSSPHMDPRILSLDSLSAGKSLSTFLKSPNNQSVFKAQPELYAYLYVNKFNTTLQSMQENAYKSKNADLFTWKQTEKYQNKITSPPSIDKKMVQMSILVNAHQPKDLSSAVTEPGLYTQTAPDIQGPRSLIAMDGSGSGVYQPRRKKLQKSQKKFYETASGTFKTQIKLDSHKFTLPTPPMTQREKTYSVMAVQRGLINDRDSPLHQVPNYQYMSNQFDRKNQTVNKIISKIHTKEDLLNREQVIEETLQKMEYVVKDIKLHKYLKPSILNLQVSPLNKFFFRNGSSFYEHKKASFYGQNSSRYSP